MNEARVVLTLDLGFCLRLSLWRFKFQVARRDGRRRQFGDLGCCGGHKLLDRYDRDNRADLTFDVAKCLDVDLRLAPQKPIEKPRPPTRGW